MEDILASIRRILAEDEPVAGAVPTENASSAVNGGVAAGSPPGSPTGSKDDVLVLDASMLAPAEPAPVTAPPRLEPSPVSAAMPEPVPEPVMMAVAAAAPVIEFASVPHANGEARPLIIRNTLPCFEDVVREALQPIIKQWLDAALPKLAERLVRTEVERVVGGVVQ